MAIHQEGINPHLVNGLLLFTAGLAPHLERTSRNDYHLDPAPGGDDRGRLHRRNRNVAAALAADARKRCKEDTQVERKRTPHSSFPSSAWERLSCKLCLPARARIAMLFAGSRKQSFQDMRSQAELGNERNETMFHHSFLPSTLVFGVATTTQQGCLHDRPSLVI